MSPGSPLEDDRGYRDLQRSTLAFSLVGLLLCVVLVSLVEPTSLEAGRAAALDLLARAKSGGARFELANAPLLLAVGVGAGLFAGMLGMGGGVLKVAGLLVFFHLDILLARAVSLTTMLIAMVTAARVHGKSGVVVWAVVRPMLGPAVLGVLTGIFLATVLTRALLTHFFGFFVLFLALNILAHSFGDPHDHVLGNESGKRPRALSNLLCRAIGAIHGFICGLLGISGGVVAIPMQHALLRVPARAAVANSVMVSAWSTVFGSTAAVLAGVTQGDFTLLDVAFASGFVGAGAIVGAQVGARLTGKIPVVLLKVMFVMICFSAALSILFK
jgi:uncharacterized membrane protein YfcA